MSNSRLKQINEHGQSIWLDYLSRDMIESGMLQRLIDEDGISGVTTNPAIFEKAITTGKAYDETIMRMTRQGKYALDIYRSLTVQDVTAAADMFYPIYESTGNRDGFVSLEVSPHLAYDVENTVKEAHELWEQLNRPNVLIKVPATEAGLQAIRQLITDGINVNVTLLFGLERYRAVAEAYLAGLEARLAAGQTIWHKPISVASLFLSRIDTLVDSILESRMTAAETDKVNLASLQGEAAVATARLAYSHYLTSVSADRFRALAEYGARPQHLLWASTGTKNPLYADTRYVEALIGPQTINTLPMETIDAYRDHGQPSLRLTGNAEESAALMTILQERGIDMQAVAQQLEDEGVQKFITAHDQLVTSIQTKCTEVSMQ
jgi:transaldolase